MWQTGLGIARFPLSGETELTPAGIAGMKTWTLPYRPPTPREFAADGLIHGIGILAGFAGVIVLFAVAGRTDGWVVFVSTAIYCIGLLAMLVFSAVYNLGWQSRHRDLFRRLDQAAIFLMIAGTYTPLTVVGLEGPWETGLIVFVWGVALVGFLLKLCLPRGLDGIAPAIYLLLGWAAIIVLDPLLEALGTSVVALIVLGGVLYSLGMIFHVWRGLPYQNAIWHSFVLIAAAVHYTAIFDVVTAG
jgi:hemolysin III